MLDSMRAQLTLWYTGVLALVLVIFAIATYTSLARAARERTDQSLNDTANSLVSNFDAESNDEDQSSEEAATEATRGFQFKDRQVLIFGDNGSLVAASGPPVETRGSRPWPDLSSLSKNLSGLSASAARAGRAYATVHNGRASLRAFAIPVKSQGKTYTIVIAQSLHEQEEALAQARRAFYVAVPLALLIASLGGYFLARKSLAPVMAIGDRAARIGASNLNERLPVSNSRNELGRLARIFNELLARLDLSFEQQRRFMADASHELRTPVAIVCGESEVALSQQLRRPEQYRESLAIVHDEGRRLTRIVEDLFMLARADAGQYQFESTNFYLDETVGECVRAVRSLAAQHGLDLQYRPAVDEMPMRGDEGLTRRMILNLLDNAIKYTPVGGRIRVDLERDDNGYLMRVTDTGKGIPAEAQSHIFERFYRVDQARSRNGEAGGSGAGLGLSIASWIAGMHGGRITLERSDRNGSTFLTCLPTNSASPLA
ncbi:MAG TPA: ATP-binding protein [Pyrinomonadaceae bacterium]|jgi:heavy metal sensor kinase|nr:ATP-binding protein [Pyrinomonadaceae bacterium]